MIALIESLMALICLGPGAARGLLMPLINRISKGIGFEGMLRGFIMNIIGFMNGETRNDDNVGFPKVQRASAIAISTQMLFSMP